MTYEQKLQELGMTEDELTDKAKRKIKQIKDLIHMDAVIAAKDEKNGKEHVTSASTKEKLSDLNEDVIEIIEKIHSQKQEKQDNPIDDPEPDPNPQPKKSGFSFGFLD